MDTMDWAQQEEIEGTVESVVYRNAENGFTVFTITCAEADELTCTGNMGDVNPGEGLRLFGRYANHPVYGRQLQVEAYERTLPNTTQGIEKYLGSGVIKGVGAMLAKRIVNRFGALTLEVIGEAPEKLAEIKGISLEKALHIGAIFHEQAELRRTMIYLQEFGIAPASALKIYNRYKGNTIDIVRTNPYTLADDIQGIGFKTADEIAYRVGIPKDSQFRLRAGIKYTLSNAAGQGHVYLPRDILLSVAGQLLDIPLELMEKVLLEMQMDRILLQEKTEDTAAVYLNGMYYAESYVARKLLELSETVVDQSDGLEEALALAGQVIGISLAGNQRLAVYEAMKHGVLVITGGPGTGKTTTINTIIYLLEKNGYEIVLAAPTGRAAKRMSEATGKPAKTIHRLLGIGFGGDVMSFDKDEDKPVEADVVIIDETSMVDIAVMHALLKAIPAGTRLILVGDVDQLPSVGPGNVLKDIIKSGCIQVVRLTEIFRQAQESAIITNAHRINRGEYPLLNEKEKDFFFVRRAAVDDVAAALVDLVMERLPSFMPLDRCRDIQVLTPMRKSSLGVNSLNQLLQARLNPPHPAKKEKAYRSIVFREGDKVMQIKNNYNLPWCQVDGQGRTIDEGLGVFNGDEGTVCAIDEDGAQLKVRYDDNRIVAYDYSQLEELELSYAITIHKSQGSEYKAVVIPIHSGPPMLMTRNLIYTAVTRARQLAVIVGIPETLYRMVDNNQEVNRYSSLAWRIRQLSAFLRGRAEELD